MEESERRLANSLGYDLCDRISPSNRLFDLSDACWLRLRLSMGVSHHLIHAKCKDFEYVAHKMTAGP